MKLNLGKNIRKFALESVLACGILGLGGCSSLTKLEQPSFKATYLESKINPDKTYNLTFKEYNPQQYPQRNKLYNLI